MPLLIFNVEITHYLEKKKAHYLKHRQVIESYELEEILLDSHEK